MDNAWDDKLNLYAFRRLLAELGFERPPSTEDILAKCSSLTLVPSAASNEEFAITFERFANSRRDTDALVLEVVASLRDAIKRTQEIQTLISAETVIREHARTLRRKRTQLLLRDDYGMADDSKWREEIAYFVQRVVIPHVDNYEIDERYLRAIAECVEKVAAEATPDPESPVDDASALLTPVEFESFCADVLESQGWKTRLTKSSGDQGIDIIAERGGITMVVQCKKYSAPIGNGAVQEVHAGKGFARADVATVVSNMPFTPSARELANVLGVMLVHHSELMEFDRLLFNALRHGE